jgi:hypothetical protein
MSPSSSSLYDVFQLPFRPLFTFLFSADPCLLRDGETLLSEYFSNYPRYFVSFVQRTQIECLFVPGADLCRRCHQLQLTVVANSGCHVFDPRFGRVASHVG